MVFYKHKKTGVCISEEEYNGLIFCKKWRYTVEIEPKTSSTSFYSPTSNVRYRPEPMSRPSVGNTCNHSHSCDNNSNGDFLTSMIVAESTGSAMLGAMVGGDMLGAFIGSEISESHHSSHESIDFNDNQDSHDYSSDDRNDYLSSSDDYSSSFDYSSSSDSTDFSSGSSDW